MLEMDSVRSNLLSKAFIRCDIYKLGKNDNNDYNFLRGVRLD